MRNLTTYVGNEQQVWTPGPGGSADAMLSFTMTVQLRIVSRSIAGHTFSTARAVSRHAAADSRRFRDGEQAGLNGCGWFAFNKRLLCGHAHAFECFVHACQHQ